MVLRFFLCTFGLHAGSDGAGCHASLADEGGEGGKSKRPTADGHASRISCSLPMLGVRPLSCIGVFGGLTIWCMDWNSQNGLRRQFRRRKMNSKVLVVICVFLRDFIVKLRCTVSLLFK